MIFWRLFIFFAVFVPPVIAHMANLLYAHWDNNRLRANPELLDGKGFPLKILLQSMLLFFGIAIGGNFIIARILLGWLFNGAGGMLVDPSKVSELFVGMAAMWDIFAGGVGSIAVFVLIFILGAYITFLAFNIAVLMYRVWCHKNNYKTGIIHTGISLVLIVFCLYVSIAGGWEILCSS